MPAVLPACCGPIPRRCSALTPVASLRPRSARRARAGSGTSVQLRAAASAAAFPLPAQRELLRAARRGAGRSALLTGDIGGLIESRLLREQPQRLGAAWWWWRTMAAILQHARFRAGSRCAPRVDRSGPPQSFRPPEGRSGRSDGEMPAQRFGTLPEHGALRVTAGGRGQSADKRCERVRASAVESQVAQPLTELRVGVEHSLHSAHATPTRSRIGYSLRSFIGPASCGRGCTRNSRAPAWIRPSFESFFWS